MSPKPRPLPSGLGPAFSTAEALALGVTRRRLRAKDLARPHAGVRLIVPEADDETDADTEPLAIDRSVRAATLEAAQAFAKVLSSGGFFWGRTSLIIQGATASQPRLPEVAVVSPQRTFRAHGISARRVESHLVEVIEFDGLPLASAASSWAMLGRDLSVRELVQVGDSIVRIPRDRFGMLRPELQLATITDLQESIDASKRRQGLGRLKTAIAMIRVGSASPLETDCRLDAREAGLPEPELDVEIFDAHGLRIGISEIVFRRQRLVVEVEGDHHRTSRQQWNRDIEKYRAYAEAGWEVLRLTSLHIRTRRSAAAMIGAALRRRGWDPRTSRDMSQMAASHTPKRPT